MGGLGIDLWERKVVRDLQPQKLKIVTCRHCTVALSPDCAKKIL